MFNKSEIYDSQALDGLSCVSDMKLYYAVNCPARIRQNLLAIYAPGTVLQVNRLLVTNIVIGYVNFLTYFFHVCTYLVRRKAIKNANVTFLLSFKFVCAYEISVDRLSSV